jgi:cyclic beta-1,2-glucan synthetase
MTEFSKATIGGLVAICSNSDVDEPRKRRRRSPVDRISILATSAYPQTLEDLRAKIIGLADEDTEDGRNTAFEWFLDNFYLIAETAQTLREDLPAAFYRELPSVAATEDDLERLPRAYLLAREVVEHASSPLGRGVLERFLCDFQEQLPLAIGELWAFPAMLRAVCLERMVDALSVLLAPKVEDEEGEAKNTSSAEEAEIVSLAVRTLLELKAVPWRLVFEHCSLVHKELLRDPAGVYAQMDFATCDCYRKVIEELAGQAGCDEIAVAVAANVVAAESPREVQASVPSSHVGYYLIDRGRPSLEQALGIQATLATRTGRAVLRFATPVYFTAIALTTSVVLALLGAYLVRASASPQTIALACLIAAVPASSFAIAWVQWLLTNVMKPKRLPRLSLEKGIDEENRSLVVIPTLFGDIEEVHDLVQRLELHYLANPDPKLGFAILADYTDALSATTQKDELLLARAQAGIDLLNGKYGVQGKGCFHLLVRERRLNASEGVWMGWERKRGKLEEFNRLLAGSRDTSYSHHVGDEQGLENIRFVITLDSDTELPRDAARRLVATLAHPLNRAHFEGERLVSGYTVLQPRLDISPEASHRSRFSRIFAGDTGLDIYSRAVSNVYQDFFGSGVYVGKGIYDVDAFRRSLEGRVPENALLSHDLFEGIYGRAGLVSDIVLYEDYPPSYLAYARRLHRWIRGDWQLLPWLWRRVPSGEGARIANPFSNIDRWKVVDNLRRSLLPLALLALFVSGWTWLPGSALVWTAAALVLSAGHVLTGAVSRLRGLFGQPLRSIGRSLVDLPNDIYRWLLSIVFLPHEAVIVTDAVLRTILRMALTRKRLLEWTTAAHTANLLVKRGQRGLLWWEMMGGPICALCVGGFLFMTHPAALGAAALFLVVWLVSPEVSLLLSRPVPLDTEALAPKDEPLLRQLSRRTWLFFETFVGPDDHWLPPDNVQMVPNLRIAHRTSPTNIGLYLASCASAYDLGYLGLRDFCVRMQATMRTLEQLPRHREQLLNWYETQTLEPLLPKYVSTVDNGNFAAALIAVRQSCSDFATTPIFRRESLVALTDVVDILGDCLSCTGENTQKEPVITEAVKTMREAIDAAIDTPERWLGLLDTLEQSVEKLARDLESAVERQATPAIAIDYETLDWLEVLTREILSMRGLLRSLSTWLYSLSACPSGVVTGATWPEDMRALRKACFGAGLEQWHHLGEDLEALLSKVEVPQGDKEAQLWLTTVREEFESARGEAHALLNEILDVGVSCEAEINKIDFSFLYDSEVDQMFIGYDASTSKPDRHHYDLLASEARLASLVAIALGQAPTKHWIHLGRPITQTAGEATLLSWSGTMFEYLMPLLFTQSHPKTLLGRSTTAAIKRQMEYADSRGVPWGISESAFATTDASGDYQYRAFGTPGLGLKRGLEDDLVIAPYASVLAVGIRPGAVVKNLGAIRELGGWGEYGAKEAIDFTPTRSAKGRRVEAGGVAGSGHVVHAYMAHHQGMSMIAISNLLAGESMCDRFHNDPRVQTVANLLQERLPADAPTLLLADISHLTSGESPVDRVVFPEPWKLSTGYSASMASRLVDPALHVLSNGNLSLLCDSFGRSRLWLTHGHDEVELRPREPAASQDRASSFCLYVQPEGEDRRLISGGLAIGAESGTEREVTFWPHKVENVVHMGSLTVQEEVFVAAHDNVEIRRVRLSNEGAATVDISVTGYAEMSIQHAEEHHRHPAFSRLFLQTSALERGRILVCQRRARGPGERFPVVAQSVLTEESIAEGASRWETSRASFIGRGGTLENPLWIAGERENVPPSGREGHVLDPCLAQQVTLKVPAGESTMLAWVTAVGIDEERTLEALSRYSQVSSLAASHDQSARAMALRIGHHNLSGPETALCQRLLSRLVHRSEVSGRGLGKANRRQLWGHGVSGDRPILLLHRRSEEPKLVQQLLRAHRFFAEQNCLWDLVVLVHDASGYIDEAREQIRRLAKTVDAGELHPNVRIVSVGQLQVGDVEALDAAAGAVFDTSGGDLAKHLSRDIHQPKLIPLFIATRTADADPSTPPLERRSDLAFDNGFGGFDQDSSEYVLFLSPSATSATSATSAIPAQTPAPWCNVLSNPSFGTLVSERGLGSTWAHNASENRLTPWSNDAVCDPPSEVLYFRDEETAAVWSPTPGPRPSPLPYEVSHGIGYSQFRHRSHGLMQTVQVRVHAQEPVKIVELKIENLSGRPRRLTSTYFADWVLGGRSATHGAFVVPSYDPEARALVACNPWNIDFPEQSVFLASSEKVHGFTMDPIEFLGLGGLNDPDALRRWGLSNEERSGALSCAALQVHIDLEPGQTVQLHFALGWGENRLEALALATRSTQPSFVRAARDGVAQHWKDLLGRVVVTTPDLATDLMLNSWALYQTISSRVYARAGFYQSSGAIGFRDQLQDVSAMSALVPALARAHILAAAAQQFEDGDVLHWWHPPQGQGVRTRCSDDLLWLPFAVSRYIETTGDDAILQEQVGFLMAPELGPNEHDRYARFPKSSTTATIYEHCIRAIDRAYSLGPHDLPLMGGGDWNDGMNLVGVEGTGESVWLGWFLYSVMDQFIATCIPAERRGDQRRLEERCEKLRGPLEAAWDGDWYRRAYYDDGTPLGSASSLEARIDSISQSWAVISGASQPDRARRAVLSAVRELVDEDARILRLLWPPFDRERREPGYIKGYPPGIRENGAQYTHAATWLVWALLKLGDGDTGAKLFSYLNPIHHSSDEEDAESYAVEPYVLSGDVYSTGEHRGRGGWSWYTGSAAWYWRVGIEELLGCRIRWPYLELAPRIPSTWPSCRVVLRHGDSSYSVEIVNSEGNYDAVVEVTIDRTPLLYTGTVPRLDLRRHKGHHLVRVVLGLSDHASKQLSESALQQEQSCQT